MDGKAAGARRLAPGRRPNREAIRSGATRGSVIMDSVAPDSAIPGSGAPGRVTRAVPAGTAGRSGRAGSGT
jgi:hypothetical protein